MHLRRLFVYISYVNLGDARLIQFEVHRWAISPSQTTQWDAKLPLALQQRVLSTAGERHSP